MFPLVHMDGRNATIWESRRAYRLAGEVIKGLSCGYQCCIVQSSTDPYLWLTEAFFPLNTKDPLSGMYHWGLVSEVKFMGDVFWPMEEDVPPGVIDHVIKDALQMTKKDEMKLSRLAQEIVEVCGTGRGLPSTRIVQLLKRVK